MVLLAMFDIVPVRRQVSNGAGATDAGLDIIAFQSVSLLDSARALCVARYQIKFVSKLLYCPHLNALRRKNHGLSFP
jgi:hypothetical protein